MWKGILAVCDIRGEPACHCSLAVFSIGRLQTLMPDTILDAR